MGPGPWDRVRQLFHDALDIPAAERAAFLQSACDDSRIRQEVETLLAGADDDSDLLQAPASEGLREALLAAAAAAPHAESSPVSPGELLKDRYRVERQLGQGGFGKVYLASDEKLYSRHVVIKVLHDENGIDPWFERRFSKEIRALASIDHPGVIGVLDTGRTTAGTLFLVMQYAEGATLRSLIEPGGMPFPRASGLIVQIAQALQAAHDCGITHHDLKPENVMVQPLPDGEERVRLIDFGIARLKSENTEESSGGETSRVVGSPAYMAPERLVGAGAIASDIYSLGVVAFELLTGRKPFESKNSVEIYKLQAAGHYTRPRELRPSLPEAAELLILQALAFEPPDRPSSARSFADQLAEALEAGPSAESPPALDTYDVFVAHASRDRAAAGHVTCELERRGIRCFLAPRDAVECENLPGAIANAMQASRCILLLFTEDANRSVELAREAQMAASAELPTFALRLEHAEPSGDLTLVLAPPHWIDVSSDLHCFDFDRIERVLLANVPGIANSSFVCEPLPSTPPEPDKPLFTEFEAIPASFRPGMRRVRLLALFALWTFFTCALAALANTGYITVALRNGGQALHVRFGYLYELNGALGYLLVVPWFIYFSIGFVLEAQVALANLASRDQIVVNQRCAGSPARTPLALIADAHRRWMSRRVLGIVFFGISLIIVGTEYLPPRSDYKHVMFGYVQAPWIADYAKQCPGCTLADLGRRLDRRIEPLGGRTIDQLGQFRIVEPFYTRTGGVVERAAFLLFMISVLGLQIFFVSFLLWTAVNGFFVLHLIYKAIAPSISSPIALYLRYADPARMFGLEPIHRALRQLMAAIAVSNVFPVLAWWTNVAKGSRRTLGQDLYSLGGWGQFLISNGSLVVALCILMYLVYIGGKAREAASEHSIRVAALPHLRNRDQMIEGIAEQSVWRSPRYTVPYLLVPLFCIASILLLNRLNIADAVGSAWRQFLEVILGRA